MIADDNLRQLDKSSFATEQLQNSRQCFHLRNLTLRFLVKVARVADEGLCEALRAPAISPPEKSKLPRLFGFSCLCTITTPLFRGMSMWLDFAAPNIFQTTILMLLAYS